MPDPILIRYKAEGVADITKAFDTIERKIAQFTAASQLGQAQRVAGAKVESGEIIAAKTAEQKAADRAENEKTRTAEREARRRQQIVDNSARMAGKFAEVQAKEEEKALQEGTRALEREMSARARIRDRSAAMAGKYAAQEAQAELSARRSVGTTVGGAVVSGTGRVLGGLASMAGMALGAGGAFAVADVARERFRAENTAAQLVNLVTSGGKTPAGANVKDILNQAAGTAAKTGMSKEDIAEGTLAYAKNARGGDFEGAMGNMEFFAKLSKTTGTSITDLGSAAGKLQSQNPNLDSKGMQQLLLNAYEMSKAGSVSLSDAVSQVGTLASTRGFYQGDVATNQRKLMALGQIAASGGATGDIGTYVKDVSIEVAAKRMHTAKELGFGGHGVESLGVKFDKSGVMESPEQMIGAIFKATGGDLSKIHGIVGNRGLPLFTELQKSFQSAGGGDKGVDAVKQQIASVSGATMSAADLDKQFAQVMSTNSAKLGLALEHLKEKVEEKALPVLERLIDKLGDPRFMSNIDGLIDGAGKLADFFIRNPFTGIGAIVLGGILKDLAGAAIGSAVKNAIIAAVGGKPIPGAGGGAIGAVAGGVLVGGTIAAAATASAFSEKDSEGAEAKATVLSLLGKPTSEADRQKRRRQVLAAIAEGKSENLNSAGNIAADAVMPAAGLVNSIAGVVGIKDATGSEEASARRERIKMEQRYTTELEEQLKKLSTVLAKGAAAVGSNVADPNHPTRHIPIDARSPTGS